VSKEHLLLYLQVDIVGNEVRRVQLEVGVNSPIFRQTLGANPCYFPTGTQKRFPTFSLKNRLVTDITPLSFRSSLEEYQKQAEELFEALRAGDPGAIQLVRHKHHRFLDASIPWLPKNLSDSEVRSVTLELADAQLAIARWYDFESWPRLAEYVKAVTQEGSPVSKFESAVEAVITGDVARLQSLLRENPDLVRARRRVSRILTRLRIGPRFFITSPPMASKVTAREHPITPLKSRRSCSKPAPKLTHWRGCTAESTRR